LLPALRDEINETVLLAMWSPQGPVVFALEESSRPVFMNVRVGSILPLLRTATGRVFASFLPREMVSDLLDAESRSSASYSRTHIKKLLDETPQHRLARVTGDLVPGVNALAAPLFDHKDCIAGVIGALGRSEELDVQYDGPIAAALLRTANEISRRLGRPTANQVK
jgi:DNA-binding IclR family transcriptional regulator